MSLIHFNSSVSG